MAASEFKARPAPPDEALQVLEAWARAELRINEADGWQTEGDGARRELLGEFICKIGSLTWTPAEQEGSNGQ